MGAFYRVMAATSRSCPLPGNPPNPRRARRSPRANTMTGTYSGDMAGRIRGTERYLPGHSIAAHSGTAHAPIRLAPAASHRSPGCRRRRDPARRRRCEVPRARLSLPRAGRHARRGPWRADRAALGGDRGAYPPGPFPARPGRGRRAAARGRACRRPSGLPDAAAGTGRPGHGQRRGDVDRGFPRHLRRHRADRTQATGGGRGACRALPARRRAWPDHRDRGNGRHRHRRHGARSRGPQPHRAAPRVQYRHQRL